MSCKISRRNFMRCAGIGALALASSSLLGGCTRFDTEYGLNEVASWTDKKGGTFTMAITQAREITAGRNEDLAENFQLKIDDNQRYVYLHIEVNNNTGEEIELYNKRYSIDWFERNYTDEVIRDHFYESEEDADVRTTYPNANKMVDAPADYMLTFKMERAKRLLASQDYSIGEIATMLGFCDSRYFAKRFKEACGICPSKYIETIIG